MRQKDQQQGSKKNTFRLIIKQNEHCDITQRILNSCLIIERNLLKY